MRAGLLRIVPQAYRQTGFQSPNATGPNQLEFTLAL